MSDGYQQHFKKVKANAPKTGSVQKPVLPLNRSERKAAAHKKQKAEESAEDYLREALRVKKAVRKSSVMPALLAGVAALGLGMGCVGYFYPTVFSGWISRVQIRAMSLAEAASDAVGDKPATPSAQKTAATTDANAAKTADGAKSQDAKSAETGPEAGKAACVEKKGFTDEELSHFNKLSERAKELDLRETELNSLEEELHKQKKEVETRIAKLEQIREEVANVLKDRVEVDQTRVSTLVEFYSNMKPKQAADIIGKLNEDLAVEVLGKMKKKNAAEILNLLDPTKARVLSEKFTGYKRES